MYLLEHDAKELLVAHCIPVPQGSLFEVNQTFESTRLPAGPWVVKGQIAAGGRGKAGIIRKAATADEAQHITSEILGRTVKDKRVDSVRIEQQIANAEEAYIGLLIDAGVPGVRVILAEHGGMDIEAMPHDQIRSETVAPDSKSILSCVDRLTVGMASHKVSALRTAALQLTSLFMDTEALLIEINPLFVRKDGTWMAGDAKIVTDDNALERQPALRELLDKRAVAYPEAALKLEHGFDYVVVDPEGDVGLLTTGAGLSMMLIDELRALGLRPFNFLDIRTGGFRGEPTRLVKVLTWLAAAPNLKVVLINIFGGIADMGEFSKLLLAALRQVPALGVPVVARLAGNGLPVARVVLAEAGIALHTDLDAAVLEVRRHLGHSSG